jgi:plastocyanin
VVVRKFWAVAGIALLAAACSKMVPPVQLSGKVNDHGPKTLTGMTATLSLEQDSFYFEPTFIKADSGAHITVTLKNESTVEHNFSITSLNINKDVEAGKTETVTVNLPSGTAPVAFFCKYHKSNGMQGAFYFK